MRYLDTIPVATSLCILKSGFLFGATESGNHGYYQVQGLGDDDDAPMCTSAAFEAGSEAVVELEPRPLRNLLQVDEMESLCPLMDAKLLTRDGTPSLVALCGKSARSTLRTLTRGLAVAEMAVSELPGNPNAVWTVKKRRTDAYDAYIVVSFVNATLVLSIGETVEEVTDSGLKSDSPTVHVALVGDDSIVQVYPSGIRHIRTDGRVNEWRPPKGKPITHATANAAQVVIALSGGEVVYFELDAQQALAEIDKKDSGHEISCLEIGAVPPGRLRSRFVALGGWDNTMRVLSLDPDDCMAVLAVLALPSQAERAVLLSIAGAHGKGAESLYLAIGLSNGVMLRARVDARSGQLSDTRTRFLGAKPARLFRIALGGAEAVLGLSSRPWALYSWQQALHTSPLSYQPLESGCSFTSEHCPEGIVAIAGNTLRIVSVDKLGDAFTSEAVPLRYTPRRMAEHGTSGHLIVIEADHNAYNDDEKAQLYEAAQLTPPLPAGTVLPDDDDADEAPLMEASVGVPRGGAGKWASCVRVLEPGTRRTLSLLELPDNEAAVSVATVTLRDRGGEALVFVGTVKDMTLHPRALSAAFIHVYQFANANATLELLHKTQVDDVPYALAAFSGRLLAGVGKSLRLYECGQKKLLRKTELRQALPTMIQSIQVVSATRIIVGDLAESFHFVKYKRADNEFLLFADDVAPRWLTATCALDLNTMAGADKFGNVYVCRLPQEVADDVEEGQLLAAAAGAEQLALNGAPSKAEEVVQFHVGETVTSLQKACLGAGCSEVLLYTTLLGGIGALLPFTSRQDLEFCQALEMHLRQEAPPLCGRDHLFFRSAFFPVKGVVDGDFCQTYLRLSPDEQRQVAEELDRTPAEVAKKLEELASRIL